MDRTLELVSAVDQAEVGLNEAKHLPLIVVMTGCILFINLSTLSSLLLAPFQRPLFRLAI